MLNSGNKPPKSSFQPLPQSKQGRTVQPLTASRAQTSNSFPALIGPPVYRPSATGQILQRSSTATAPPVYRPYSIQRAVPKHATGAPPAYSPYAPAARTTAAHAFPGSVPAIATARPPIANEALQAKLGQPRAGHTDSKPGPAVARMTGQAIQRVKRPVQGDIFYDTEDGRYYRKTADATWANRQAQYELLDPQPQAWYYVGGGNLSYEHAMVKAHATPTVVHTPTTYDREDRVKLYPGAPENISAIAAAGATVLHGVDATDFRGTASPRRVDKLIWVHPHTGLGSGKESDSREHELFIRSNQMMLRGFFRSAHDKLSSEGIIEITIKATGPYLKWEMEELASEEGWQLIDKDAFKNPSGYVHVLTKDLEGEVSNNASTTFSFQRRKTVGSPAGSPLGVPYRLNTELLIHKLEALARERDLERSSSSAPVLSGGTTVIAPEVERKSHSPSGSVPVASSSLSSRPSPVPTAPRAVRYPGKIKWFDSAKGFGFITRTGKPDLYFRLSNVLSSSQAKIHDKAKVSFEVVPGDKPYAKNISVD
jgi:CspA family cold shock protein